MNKQQVHQYVLEHITGSLKARENSKQLLGIVFGISVIGSVIILLSNTNDSSTIGLAVATLLAGIPFGVIAQRSTLRIALSRESLRLKRFLIGKKGYVAPKDDVLHEHADLFAIAANLVCQEPFFSPQSNAAAWHTYSVMSDIPGIATYVGWYGNNTEASIFLYGDLHELTELSSDIWDLGHVRKLTASDRERFTETAKGWKRQQLHSVALAYAPLTKSADPTNITSKDIQDSCVLLGALGLGSTRGYSQTMSISPAVSVRQATFLQTSISLALVLLTTLSVVANKLFGVPLAVNMLLLLTMAVFIVPIILAVFSWDSAVTTKTRVIESLTGIIWHASIIAVTTYATFLLYLYWQDALGAASGSVAQQTGAAIAVLTFGLCTLLHIILTKLTVKKKFTLSNTNPLYLLAWSSGLLLVLIISYGTGPLLIGGIILAVGATLFYGSIRELKMYADHHHSREHILELLKSV